MRYSVIQAHRDCTPVRWQCSALGVSPRGYYAWRRRDETRRCGQELRLLTEIRTSYEASKLI